MILVTGGAYQGKSDYVCKKLGITKKTEGSMCDFNETSTAECVTDYHRLVKRLIEAGIDPIGYTERLCRENTGLVVVINEIGSGIIPIEKQERLWREAVGRCGCIIAQKSDTVVRMVCGIPHILKGELP